MPQERKSGRDASDRTARENQPAADRSSDAARGNSGRRTVSQRLSERLTATALRGGLATVGFVLLLFALGQAVGFDLLGLFAEAVTSQTGRWLVVALFALLLIGVAGRATLTRSST